MTEDLIATLQAANAAIAQGDIDGFLVHCTDDIVWDMVGDTRLEGKAAVRRWMQRTYAVPPRFSADRFVVQGDDLVVMGEITLTGAEGRTTQSSYCDVWRFRGGKLAALKAFAIEVGGA